jgi:hypothetical protein
VNVATSRPLGIALPLESAVGYGFVTMNRRSNGSTLLARRDLLAASGAFLALSALPRVALAGNVRGKITGYQYLENPVWKEAKDPAKHGYSFREPVPTVRAEFRKLFPNIAKELCVAAFGTERQTPKPLLVRVGGGRTTPVTLVVAPGTELQFKNADPFTHRLYSPDFPAFSVADTIKGGIRKWTVPEARTYELRDEAAPSVRMWIVADPSVTAITYPALSGDFVVALPGPGEYRLQVFFSGKKVGSEQAVKLELRDVELPQPIAVATKDSGAAAGDNEKD